MNTLKKLLKIVFLFILTTYGCMILSAINLWLFQYINAQFKKIVALGYLIQQKYRNDIRNMLP